MSEQLPLTAGFFPSNDSDHAPGVVRVCVFQPPFFAPTDEHLKFAPRVVPLKSLFVERRVSIYDVGGPIVRWCDGKEINKWARAKLPKWMKNRIDQGIRETLRVAGGSRAGFRNYERWYQR